MDINVLTWNGKPEEKAKLETLLDKHKKLRREGVEEVPQKGGGSAAEEVSAVGQHKTGFPAPKKSFRPAVPSPNVGTVATGSKTEEQNPL